ncbi:MAG: hydroxyacylglutathione hydrolase [Actinomycetota bacterium]|jgi:glyoxylase-like metal-dependent hydrolase (beta-lactamase superfamily II)|nr:hydroxyacylglutathione hydrolase [Actinomycetota bacterium]
MLIEGIPLWLASTNAWIVAPSGPGGECVLIDAPPDPTAILSRIAHHELKLVALLSTHGHIDHVGGIAEVVKASGGSSAVPVHIHDHDRHMLLDPVGTSASFGQYLEKAGLDVRPPEVIESIDDGQRISGAGMTFTALHTPGHTRGSVCFRLDVEGERPVLFSGDHLFKGSIGRFDMPGGSFDELMESMASKILPLDDDIAVLPGHGDVTTIGQERQFNPFLLELQQQLGE